MYEKLLSLIVKNKVGKRPGRIEPRMIKRGRKAFPLLHRARIFEKNKLTRKIEKRLLKQAD